MNAPKFQYDVQIGSESRMFQSEIFSSTLPAASEMYIKSEEFDSYDDCETSLTNLMAVLTRFESNANDTNYVIVKKINPVIDGSEKKHSDASTWDKNTLIRVYMADSEALKNSVLRFQVVGQITVDRDVTAFKAEITKAESVD